MATSWVEICNLALVSLGSQPITQLAEDSNNARLCNGSYRLLADEVLCEHEWGCATMRQDLNALSVAPSGTTWAYQFQLPVSPLCLKIRKLDPTADYLREGGVILCNESAITLVYTYQVVDPTVLDPMLVAAIAARIALHLAPKIVQRDSVTASKANDYEKALIKAKWADNYGKSSGSAPTIADPLSDENLEDVH
jgi:hypothetical protein